MRCLYCGKELALLKRWTGGGEFCSDAHRQQYQEEYNQLALNRLLQAKPQEAETKAGAKAADSKSEPKPSQPPVVQQVPSAPAQVRKQEAPAMAAVVEAPLALPEYIEPEPEPVEAEAYEYEAEEEPEEDRAPAEPAGFLLEVPVPVPIGAAAIAASETDFERHSTPTLPTLTLNGWGTELVAAGQVMFDPSIRVVDYATRVSEGRLEVREFVRGAPIVEFDIKVSGETGIMESSEEPMDILIFPQPPPGTPELWQEPEREFSFEMELGPHARVVFKTTGIEDNEEGDAVPSDEPPAIEAASEPAVEAPLELHVEEPVKEIVKESLAEEVKIQARIEPAPVAAPPEPPKPEPVVAKVETAPVEAPKPAVPVTRATVVRNAPPVFQKPMFRRPVDPALVRPAESSSVRPTEASPMRTTSRPAFGPDKRAVEKPGEKVPDVATKPLPLTLHGLAAGRGKPVQVFPSAVASGVDLQIPRSTGLPLRPVMTLGPAPAAAVKEAPKEEKKPERSVLIKPDTKKRPDPRLGNGKGRKPEPEKVEEKKPQPVAKEIPVEAKREEIKPEPVKAAIAKPEPVKAPEPVKEAFKEPITLSKPYITPDLGLPSLSLDASGSFWSRMPVVQKIGASLLVALVIGGIFYMMSKGGGTVAGDGPRVVEAAPALPATEAGWITDWGAEPGVRRQHEISILRASQNLTDYRLSFEAQIESKALGWIYRAKDPKNYYVNKLEIVKPGLDPTVALVRFAVINGEEQPRAQFPLSLPVHIDTLYNIRFDAVGDRFTTYVQDQKVDEWTDGRIKIGGIGLYNERGESKSVKGGVNVVPLVVKR